MLYGPAAYGQYIVIKKRGAGGIFISSIDVVVRQQTVGWGGGTARSGSMRAAKLRRGERGGGCMAQRRVGKVVVMWGGEGGRGQELHGTAACGSH